MRELARFIKIYDFFIEYYKNKNKCINKEENDESEKLNTNLNKEGNNESEKLNSNLNKEENKESEKINTNLSKEGNIKSEKSNSNLNKEGNEESAKLKSIIISIYLCYYMRIVDGNTRSIFESKLKPKFITLVNNNYVNKSNNEDFNEKDLIYEGAFKKDLQENYKISPSVFKFSQILTEEENFLLDNIHLDKGIGKNKSLKENIFLLFTSINTSIPLVIIGKPGSSKSLSFQQLKKSMRGNYSKSNFFRKYPQILTTYFQGSESTLAEDIDNLFEIGKEKLTKYENNKQNKPISLLIFDEIGLSEFAKDNPVKVLHKNLEYDGVKDGLSFVGFSNWKLDSSKLNRVLYLSIPDLDRRIDDLKDTAKCIAESIRKNNIDQELLDLLSKSYKSYIEMIKKIKDYVVYKELILQEMKQYLDSLPNDIIKKQFGKEKNKQK